MPGKRLKDPSLTRTNFTEAVANGAELLTDWEGLVWARPIPITLIGNSWWQGSYDSITWSNEIENDHAYARVSTDGGITWLVFKMSDCDGSGGDLHPPVTIGSPDGGLVISGDDTQILTLNSVTTTNPGAIEPDEYIKILNLKFDYFDNVGGGFEVYKDYTDSGDDRTHNIRTLVPGANTTLSYVGDTIVINSNTSSTTGQANTGHNDGTLGVGVYDRMNGDILEFRNIHSTGDIITVTLDDINNNIALEIVEANINHDILENFVPNEHIDHSTVSILTTEGITGGGDITTTRTLSLAFDELFTTLYDENDYIAVYDPDTDTHYTIPLSAIPSGTTYEPVNIIAGLGLSGGGLLDQDRTVRLSINSLPTVPYDTGDYVAVYDVSGLTHGKVTLLDLIGELAVSISAGAGMDFTTITSTGSVILGTPSTINETSVNLSSGTTHTHAFDMSTFELSDLGDVTDSPTTNYYLQWNGTSWVTSDPALGATLPGAPLNSIQFNNNSTFGGNAGLLYNPTVDTIYFTDTNASSGVSFIFGADTTYPYLATVSTNGFLISNYDTAADYIRLYSNRLLIGNVIPESDYYLGIVDPNATEFSYLIKAQTNLGLDLMMLGNDGQFYLPELNSGTASNILYFNSTTGVVTFGAASTGTGGGISTLIADTLSGLMVNGGNTSSAAIIELDQNDNKLTAATPEISDYIGFWDVSGLLQSKTLISNLPGWSLNINGINEDAIQPGNLVNFVSGNNIGLSYDNNTNSLTISNTQQIDLYTQGALRESNISVLDISSTNIAVSYSSPGKVTLSYDSTPPPYTHLPDAFAAFNNYLYSLDLSEGTANRLQNAPSAPWNSKTSFAEGDYIFTTNGSTLYRYTISTDTTESVVAGLGEIKALVNASDGLYAISNYAGYHIDKSTLIATFYGDSLVSSTSSGNNYPIPSFAAVKNGTTGTEYILFYSDTNDRFYYKEIKSTYIGADTDDWTAGSTGTSENYDRFGQFITDGFTILHPEADNTGKYHLDISSLSPTNPDYTTYDNPSGRIYSSSDVDSIVTVDTTLVKTSSSLPTTYTAVQSNVVNDSGIYYCEDNYSFYAKPKKLVQAVSTMPYDIHAEYIQQGGLGFDYKVNVIVGGIANERGTVYLHLADEAPGQFNTIPVSEVTNNGLHAEPVTVPITFVYFDSTYTGGGIPPKTLEVVTGIDLHVNNALVQEQVPKIDIIEGAGINVTYSGDAGITIAATPIIEDISFVFSDVTGDAQTYIIDLLASFDYEIISMVIKSDASVGFNLIVNSVNVLTNTSTTSTTTHAVASNVSEGHVVELTLATSSATEIVGKLRIQRL